MKDPELNLSLEDFIKDFQSILNESWEKKVPLCSSGFVAVVVAGSHPQVYIALRSTGLCTLWASALLIVT